MKKLFVLVILVVLADLAYGQGIRSRNRNFIIGAGTGAAFYFGDLAKNGDFSNIKPNFALSARYNFYDRYSVETQLTWFMLTGDDSKDPVKEWRNLSFTSHNFELNVVGHVSLFPEAFRFYQRPFANPYVYGGIGLLQFNPYAKLDGEVHYLRGLETEGPENSYGLMTMVIPFGAGVKFRATPFLNINIDGGYRITFTDYLDDVSSGYFPEPTSFEGPNQDIARRLSDRSGELDLSPTMSERGMNVRGNPDRNDAYFILNIRAEYFFGSLRGGGPSYRPMRGKKPKAYRPKKYKRRR